MMRRWSLLLAGIVVVGLAIVWHTLATRPSETVRDENSKETPFAGAEAAAQFCGDCHAIPNPASFPKSAWHDEVQRGFGFYESSGRTDLKVPVLDEVVAYFRARAPDALEIPEIGADLDSGPIAFRQQPIALPNDRPSVAHLVWCRLGKGRPLALAVADMWSGAVSLVDPKSGTSRQIASVGHPCHLTPCDLDGDGFTDLLVADLGSFLPADHNKGRVLWLRFDPGANSFQPHVLCEHLGRVADVDAVDVDGDGKLDLLVAEFGWHKTGSISWWRQIGTNGEVPTFQRRLIDARPGAIHVVPADLAGKGRRDFVALISQDHETVQAFVNNGAGAFVPKTIFRANDPAFGSSGIQLVDLNGDGKVDVLYTNGDSFDSMYVKPYHAIWWLENRGTYPYTAHRLTPMPGVLRALAGDLDGDGDLDIAAVALLPDRSRRNLLGRELPAVVWLEQTTPGRFAMHVLSRAACQHAALEIADLDGDGRHDLAVGNFVDGADPSAPSLTIWWNLGRKEGTAIQKGSRNNSR